MQHILKCTMGAAVAFLIVAGPTLYAQYRQSQFRNFRMVRCGVLYRSGQLSLPALRSVIHDHGIETVVTLRDAPVAGQLPPDIAEEKYCISEEINYYRISPRTWWAPDGSIPAEVGVRQFREIMDNPSNYPVLVHCYAGIHRTGAYSAVYRMEYENWSNADAIAEMRTNGYRDLDDEWDLLSYLEHYVPRRERSSR